MSDELGLQKTYDSLNEYSDKVTACVLLLVGTIWWTVERHTFKVCQLGPLFPHPTENSCVTDKQGQTRWWPNFKQIGIWQKYDIIFKTKKEALKCAIYNHQIERNRLQKLVDWRDKAIIKAKMDLENV